MNELPGSPNFPERRSERRVRVHLPVEVRGTDGSGARFDEQTVSEDLCRGGVAFSLSRALELGADLDIHIPLPARGKQDQTDFTTRGQVRHVHRKESGCIIGVAFTGPRLHRLFSSETATPA